MENTQETKQLILDAKNIYIIPSQEPEAIASTLALFYTLKELGKNVNLLVENLQENLKFLTPSLDFISYPKNFVISIPNNIAKISQIYYEKNDQALKIHLTVENGNIKKEGISYYYSETKPDLIITVGIKDYSEQLAGRLNSFGFLLDSTILNIDTSLTDTVQANKKFGKINLIENVSLAEILYNLAKTLGVNVSKNLANCLLTGLILYTNNFKDKVTAEIFEQAASLMKSGAEIKIITENIYGRK